MSRCTQPGCARPATPERLCYPCAATVYKLETFAGDLIDDEHLKTNTKVTRFAKWMGWHEPVSTGGRVYPWQQVGEAA